MNLSDFKMEVKLVKLEVKLKYIHDNKNKSQSNGKRPFYYFDIDSYTRVNYMDLLHKNKRKSNRRLK